MTSSIPSTYYGNIGSGGAGFGGPHYGNTGTISPPWFATGGAGGAGSVFSYTGSTINVSILRRIKIGDIIELWKPLPSGVWDWVSMTFVMVFPAMIDVDYVLSQNPQIKLPSTLINWIMACSEGVQETVFIFERAPYPEETATGPYYEGFVPAQLNSNVRYPISRSIDHVVDDA